MEHMFLKHILYRNRNHNHCGCQGYGRGGTGLFEKKPTVTEVQKHNPRLRRVMASQGKIGQMVDIYLKPSYQLNFNANMAS